MVETYVQFPENQNTSQEYQVLRPNITKIVIKNAGIVVGITVLVIGALILLNQTVGLDVFLDIFEMFGIEINTSTLLLYMILAAIGASVLFIAFKALEMKNVRYEIYPNRLISYQSSSILMTDSKEIPYQNIVKITYKKDGIFNTLFNTGTIVLELSGMDIEKLEMGFMDNIEQTVQYIQNVMQQYRNLQQAQFTENYRIDGIVRGI